MRRRAFIAALPVVALPLGRAAGNTPASPAATTDGPGQGGAAHAPATSLPGFQPEGAERFIRPDVHAGDRPSGASFASRSAAMGLNGAAGTAHPIATQTAIEILKRGGSAIDAAVAANACLGFLEPTSAGLGGDCYAMVWDPKLGRVVGLAGSGASPRGLSLETVRSRAKNGALPPLGAVSVSVPGALDAWWSLHQRYGKLPWADLFQPAIRLATEGVPVPQIIGYYIYRNMRAFVRPGSGVEETANALHTYAPGGNPPREGDVFRNPDLARTYGMIAQGGRDAFYDGPIADTIEHYFKRIGGWMTRDDLRRHHSEWNTPLVTTYRGVEVYGMAANTQGLATLQMLNMLEHFDLRQMGFQSPSSLQVQIEAKRLAYEDRARYYADPKFAKVPVEWLNSKEYAAERVKLIRPDRINPDVRPGNAPSHGDTTYYTMSDQSGMMVSMIQSNFRGMGSGLVADGLGFMFQDRGQLFSLRDGHPNLYQPGKRPFQTIIPGFATRGGQPWMSFGVMGGDMQPMGQQQIITNRVDYGLDIQAAGDSPRWHHEGSSQSMGEDHPGLPPTGILRLESGVPDATRKAMVDIGWTMAPSDGGFGRYECIEHRMNGRDRVYAAASEMRADGCALAF
ncbi:gamma-glutamyltransferase family protein [Lichenicola cladoniae]|uniref:Gamma-glutamyltransferase family protein n=1 Tax=Lichenicola cladoniae TaxID=1484109 RepID=A0A6M8HS59_9PROT|nr:gamma-glutamyltransferase family protein [Lichenicola cladoniae]NPD65942.1 gamma-glutamyltransferase family protein [Acetobacteraceae bacterium]QKE91067.1 gamma-glutamyltransferase family protein [Lichenicola cladoniae]